MQFLSKAILGVALLAGIFWTQAFAFAELKLPPQPAGMVLDEADLLTPEQEVAIDVDLQAFDLQTSVQMVVVTLPDLQGYEAQQFALELGRAWGVGQKDIDNGLVFLVAPNDRVARIEVGYGLEGAIPDALASQILDTVVTPEFAEGRYFEGIQNGLAQLKQAAQGDYPVQIEAESSGGTDVGGLILFVVYLVFSVLANTKSWWLGGIVGGIAGGIIMGTFLGILGGALIGFLLDFIASKYIGPHIGGGSGGHFMGGSGGGFGGFGGGSFGGGGASGRW